MTTTQAALVLAVIASAAVVAGAVVLWGFGVALLAGGVLGLVAAVVLYDPKVGQ